MRLSHLKITGFKGFADPVEIPIRNGLSGIVGPNGCGKSNIVDAIGWVMGESRPTAIRGAAMDDVIFSGSATRPASSFAEVQLEVEDPSERTLSGLDDVADGEPLVMARRLDHLGNSRFLANGKEIRRRDVQLLFADSASGSRSYSLVRQGQTSELVNARPSARSGILQDAAGISGLSQRRHEAELKLSAATQNLERAEDILKQIRAQLASLARQARQANRYRSLGERLRKAEAFLLYLQWKSASDAAVEAEANQARCVAEAARLQQTAMSANRLKDELEQALGPLRKRAAETAAALQRLKAQSQIIEEQEINARNALKTLRTQISQLQADIQRELGLKQDAEERLVTLKGLEQELEEQDRLHEPRMSTAIELLEDASRTLKVHERDLDASNRQLADMRSAQDVARRAVNQAKRNLQSCIEREKVSIRDVEKGKLRLSSASDAVEKARAALALATEGSSKAASGLDRYESERAWVQADLIEARDRHAIAESQARVLETEEAELRKLLKAGSKNEESLLNRIDVEPGFEAALGAALGDDLFFPELREGHAAGWVSLEPLGEFQSLPEGVTTLARHVSGPAALDRRLAQVGLAEPAEMKALQSRLKPGQRIVSKDGDLCRWDGFVLSGKEVPRSATTRLRQVNRLAALEERIGSARAEHETAKEEFSRLSTKFKNVDRAHREAVASHKTAEGRLSSANRAMSETEADAGIAERALVAHKDESARRAAETLAAKSALETATLSLEEQEDLTSIGTRVEALESAVADARDKVMEARSGKDDLEREQAARSSRLRDIPVEIDVWSKRLESARKRIEEISVRQSEARSESETAERLPDTLADRKRALNGEIHDAESREVAARNELAEAEGKARKAGISVQETERQVAAALERKGRSDGDAANARTALDRTIERIASEVRMRPQQLAERLEFDLENLPSVDEQEIEVNRLQRSREALGAVNLRAEQDSEELQASMVDLEAEKEDLEQAVAKLRRTIVNLNSEGRERLLTAFESVNENFQEMFKKVFGGGRARLELVEGEDPLETELEIYCNPPGKRFSTISLLSGGEQTLTAVALIFAFFLANPAPICILDEVDAPLDDANVGNFCNLVSEVNMRTGTRFLVITHNPITMAAMDRLFGVTMQERGVSKVVSVDLGQAERLAA